MPRFSLAACFLVLAVTNCKRTAPIGSSTPRPQSASERSGREVRRIEGCSLITKEEIGAVQKTIVTDAKGSETSDGRHLIAQCYYATTGTNLSVSIAVTQFDPNNVAAANPRDVWEETFGRFRKEETETEKKEGLQKDAPSARRGREEGEERTPPKKIDGVGEEAFWTGNRFGGALYVLKGDVFIRISVGGPDDQETKIEKSKTLAQKALSSLP
jgi:hypothetical protein